MRDCHACTCHYHADDQSTLSHHQVILGEASDSWILMVAVCVWGKLGQDLNAQIQLYECTVYLHACMQEKSKDMHGARMLI